jgi:glycosyltransferase involved in cell wall biosynthesis
VEPDAPGGIETLLPGLSAALRRADCESTVLAVAGSSVAGELVPVVDSPIYERTSEGSVWEFEPYVQDQLLSALAMADGFDVIHSHVGPAGWVLSGLSELRTPVLHTQHNPVSPDMEWFVRRHPDLPLSTVSEYQARKLRAVGATRCHVVHNGIDFGAFPLQTEGKSGLVYLGRLEYDKGTDIAIRVARALDLPLTLAGPPVDHTFFETEIEPQLDDQIRYAGVLGHAAKSELLGGAGCVLLPTRSEEGFGLVTLEAMACGTPVVALANGALPEVVEEGVTGYLTADERELPELAVTAMTLAPENVRAMAERRFSVAAAAEGYLGVYRLLAIANTPLA